MKRAKILLIAPRFFDAKYGEKRAMRSAVTTARSLSTLSPVVVVTAGAAPRYERISSTLSVYRLWDLFIPDPVNLGLPLGLFWSLLAIMRREQPNAYLVNKHMFFTGFAVPFLRLLGKRVILQTDTFPGMNWFPRNTLVKYIMIALAWTAGLLILKSASRVVLLHEGLVPVAKRLRLPYHVIHNGVDIAKFDRFAPAVDLAKKSKQIFVGYVGRLESVKGYDDFLAVAQQLAPDYPQVTFFFVGSTEGKEELVQTSSTKQIRFLGHRSDVPAVLKRFDIFVLPSYSEGLPNALMEAMAAGCATVASNVGGVKILLRDGLGRTFKPGDRGALRTQLEALITNSAERRRLGQKARMRIERDFNLHHEAEKLHAVVTGASV